MAAKYQLVAAVLEFEDMPHNIGFTPENAKTDNDILIRPRFCRITQTLNSGSAAWKKTSGESCLMLFFSSLIFIMDITKIYATKAV